MELTFTVTNQKIKYTGKQYVVASSQNILTARFIFNGADWKNVGKTALFKKGDDLYGVLLDSDNCCTVPYEVLETTGVMEVSVWGGNLITADAVQVEINRTIFDSSSQPGTPTEDVYNQILSELTTIRVYYAETEEQLSTIEQTVADALEAIETGVAEAEAYADTASDYADSANEYATKAKHWAVGVTLEDEDGTDTNNSMYWATRASDYADTAQETLDSVVTAINEAVETNTPSFTYDFTDGHLYWEGGAFTFSIDSDTMHLLWEVS